MDNRAARAQAAFNAILYAASRQAIAAWRHNAPMPTAADPLIARAKAAIARSLAESRASKETAALISEARRCVRDRGRVPDTRGLGVAPARPRPAAPNAKPAAWGSYHRLAAEHDRKAKEAREEQIRLYQALTGTARHTRPDGRANLVPAFGPGRLLWQV